MEFGTYHLRTYTLEKFFCVESPRKLGTLPELGPTMWGGTKPKLNFNGGLYQA
jgi:hypothetical protein